MTGNDLLKKLQGMTQEERAREVIIEDYSGVTAQFLTLDKINLEDGREDKDNDPEKILGKPYIGLGADNCYFLG